jgi:hypothetical protein
MKENYKLIAKMNLEFFYSVNVTKYGITLQGKPSVEVINYIRMNYMVGDGVQDFYVDDNGHTMASIMLSGVKIDIALL